MRRRTGISWGKEGTAEVPALKNFLTEIRQGMMPMTLLKQESVGNTDEATKELREVIPDLKYTPKPVRLIKHLAEIANLSPTDIVLDFFAGSGTTGLAVLALNAEEKTDRRFVLVQLQEPTGRKDFATITEITKERIRRVVRQMKKQKEVKGRKGDLGFRVSTLGRFQFRSVGRRSAEEPKAARTTTRNARQSHQGR